VVFYIFVVAVLNLGLGVAVATYLGRRHQALVAGAAENGPLGRAPATPPEPTPVVPELAAAADAPAPAAPQNSAQTEVATGEDRPESPGAVRLSDLQVEVDQYHQQLAQTDDALRCCAGTADAAAIEACLASLMEATNEYLRRRDERYRGFEGLYPADEDLHGARHDLQEAIQRQDEQIRSTSDSMRTLDCQKDLESGCRQVLGQTSKLLDVNHHLRDTLDGVLVEIARNEQRFASGKPAARNDRVTGIPGRAALEAGLAAWWQQDPQRVRQLSAALIDIDHFAQVNEHFGPKVGDRALRAIAQVLEAERRGEVMVARFAGQRFFLLAPDGDLRSTIHLVERIRQTIELTRFRYRESDIRLTVSCAVTEATAEDTSATLFARTEATLREAKRYGRNRTFLHEGKYPTPVVPPNCALEERQFPL